MLSCDSQQMQSVALREKLRLIRLGNVFPKHLMRNFGVICCPSFLSLSDSDSVCSSAAASPRFFHQVLRVVRLTDALQCVVTRYLTSSSQTSSESFDPGHRKYIFLFKPRAIRGLLDTSLFPFSE